MSAILTSFLFVLSTIQEYMFKTHTSVVNFFNYPFSFVDFCLMYFKIILLTTYRTVVNSLGLI